ncbi:MAG: hypothetical protein RIT81_02310 [Deltaproteobacteria bacterium]
MKRPPRSALLLLLFSTGCVGELSFDPGAGDATYGGAFDLATADSLWAELEGHESWPSFPGKEGIVMGASPHGAYQTLHVNDVAAADLDTLAFGSVVVKRNFADEAATDLKAVTVMKRVRNFNPDQFDWFWAQYEPDGTVALDDAGTPLAGAVGKDGGGCIGCHVGAGEDYLFSNGATPTFGGDQDLERAGTLWAAIATHTSWPSFTGLDGMQPGTSPHGDYNQFHLNDVAAADESGLGSGSIIVKRNHLTEDPASLVAITVMQRVDGFAPDRGDWFWAKFTPAGALDTNEAGVPLAGRVDGCTGCHASAPGDDFVFVNDGGTEG